MFESKRGQILNRILGYIEVNYVEKIFFFLFFVYLYIFFQKSITIYLHYIDFHYICLIVIFKI